MTAEIDTADRAIIDQLQLDGRRSYGRIGEAVGLSEGAVRQRVGRLRRSDAIRIVAVTDPETLGFRMRATVGLRIDGHPDAVAEALAPIPEVDYVVSTAGRFDLLIEVQCESQERFFALLNDTIKAIPGVRDTETFVYLKLHKQTYPWPP
jgi:Lrp/AsnC family transcriptional regulator, regulator for asnA, asnC and gidA